MRTPIALLVTGGRSYADRVMLWRALDDIHVQHDVGILVHGSASGADRIAAEWARCNGVPSAAVPALWGCHGTAAGPIRNAAMLLLRPDLVLAAPGGRGTDDMVARAARAGIPVREVLSR